MIARLLALLACIAAASAQARPVEPIDDLQWLVIEDIVGALFAPDEAARTQAAPLMEQARRELFAGRQGEARRLYAHARIVLDGVQWNAANEYAASLALRPERVVIDPARPLLMALGQHFHAAAPSDEPLQMRIFAREWQRRPDPDLENAVLLASLEYHALDLIEQPLNVRIDPSALRDGSWELVADIWQGEQPLGRSSTRIFVASGLERDRQIISAQLAALDLRPGVQASIAYPLDLANGLDLRTRKVRDVNIRGALNQSLALLNAARAGEDPLWQARGNHSRHYRSALSGQVEAYALSIPSDWDGETALPLAVMLHGSMGDEQSVFAEGELEQIAGELGLAILSPFGADPNSGWGNRLPVVLADGSIPAPRPVVQSGRVQPVHSLSPDPAEVDVATVLRLTMEEIPIDETRIYLGGNSMGGEGAWHFGTKWPGTWAAIAPGAGPIDPAGFPYSQLGDLPVLIVHGQEDEITSFTASQEMLARLNAAGGNGTMLAPHAGHDAYSGQLREVLEFFMKHRRQEAGPDH